LKWQTQQEARNYFVIEMKEFQMKLFVPLIAVIALSSSTTLAQLNSANAPGPAGPNAPGMEAPTKLEALELRKSTIIIKGYTEVGKVDGEEGSSITVSAIEMKDTKINSHEMGIAIQASGGAERERSAISYVDYEELAALLTAIDSLAKPDPTATRLSAYEAQYRTRSNLEFTSFDNNNQRMISVRAVQVIFPSGEVIWSTAHFRLATLASIRKQITDAKELLDKIREEATK
jgi:hypothetical protein